MCKSVCYCRFLPSLCPASYPGQEVGDCHGGGGPVAPLDAAMFAERYEAAAVRRRLVGVVVVGQKTLPELTLIMEDGLQGQEGEAEIRPHSRHVQDQNVFLQHGNHFSSVIDIIIDPPYQPVQHAQLIIQISLKSFFIQENPADRNSIPHLLIITDNYWYLL